MGMESYVKNCCMSWVFNFDCQEMRPKTCCVIFIRFYPILSFLKEWQNPFSLRLVATSFFFWKQGVYNDIK